MNFYEYMNYFIDIEEIKAIFLILMVFLVSYTISKIIMYFADRHYTKVIDPTFKKYRSGAILTDKERQIIDKYKV